MVGRSLKIVGKSLLVLGLATMLSIKAHAFFGFKKKSDDKIKIGITQIVEHPALDSAKNGFIEALNENGYADKVTIEEKSAQGDMSIAQNIANSFVSDKKDLILAIATPTAQAAFNATKDIPILITAVTDPVKAGLVGNNITGTSDLTPVKKQLELLKTLFPSAKKVGIVYNLSEQNSEIQIEIAKEEGKKLGLEFVLVGVSNINEVSQGLDSLLSQVDALYTPTDNLVASAMPLLVDRATKKNIPIIGAEKAHVEAGALATEGIDYFKLGKQTGMMAIKILEGAKPSEFKVETLEDTEFFINSSTAKNLNLAISEELLNKATVIK